MERIEDCISFLLGKAAQRISRRARELLTAHGVTPVQYAVLKTMSERDGWTGSELGARLAIDGATMTGILDRLSNAGFIRRLPDESGDRRVHRLVMTALARERQPVMDDAMDALNAEVDRLLGAGESGRLRTTLRQIGGIDL